MKDQTKASSNVEWNTKLRSFIPFLRTLQKKRYSQNILHEKSNKKKTQKTNKQNTIACKSHWEAQENQG